MPAPASNPPPSALPAPPAGHDWPGLGPRHPLPAALAGALAVTVALFYVAVPLFFVPNPSRQITAFQWIRAAWNPETHYEHGPLVPLIILFSSWQALPNLRGVAPKPSTLGLVPLLFGVLLFLLGSRALQPRLAWGALPFLLFGAVLYTAGWRAARAVLFSHPVRVLHDSRARH